MNDRQRAGLAILLSVACSLLLIILVDEMPILFLFVEAVGVVMLAWDEA